MQPAYLSGSPGFLTSFSRGVFFYLKDNKKPQIGDNFAKAKSLIHSYPGQYLNFLSAVRLNQTIWYT